MADFLGSYYDSAEIDGELDEKVISQTMALLSLEQPVSVLDMDNLDSKKLPERLTQLDALDNEDKFIPAGKRRSSDEDFEIPVASMSAFDQEKPTMVSVQLQTLKGFPLNRNDEPLPKKSEATKKDRPKVHESFFGYASETQLAHKQEEENTPNRKKAAQRRVTACGNNELLEENKDSKVEKRSPNVKLSLLKLFGRKPDQKNRRK